MAGTDTRSSRGTCCWLLHRRAYRRSSAIWEILTDAGERLAVVARAVRAVKKRSPAAPGPCSRLRIWYRDRGGGDLHSLQRCEPERAVLLPPRALLYGLAANELLVRCTHRGERNAALGPLYGQWMEALATAGEAARRGLHLGFQLDLLAAIGYGLSWQTDATGEAIREQCRYRLNADFRLQIVPSPGEANNVAAFGNPADNSAHGVAGWCGADLLAIGERRLTGEPALACAQFIASRLLEAAMGGRGRIRGHELLSQYRAGAQPK